MKRFIQALLCALFVAGCDDIGEVAVEPIERAQEARPEGWDAVFARPVPMRVTGFITGWVEAGPEILIDDSDPRVPEAVRQRLWVPSIAYLVEHPTQGRILLDAGLRSGDCAYGTQPLYWVPCRNRPDEDAVAQLAKRGIAPSDLGAVMISHFHGDHVSGLGALLRGGAPRILTTEAEIEGIASAFRVLAGYEASMLQEKMKAVLADPLLRDMPVVDKAADFFGDGSLWLIPTPGHTSGHLAALINTLPQPLLFTFDASHLKAGFDLGVPPGATVDREMAVRSLEKLRSLARSFPQIKVIYGHEPTQWPESGGAVTLAGG